ncbi:hypothetical protein [Amycolatopsis alkalitolerans]|uniref:Uncharacterized protein n=1 Tax=Amycolatopsis alkalitolerans TaxID=2547244 RepID=A0A5C4MB74_9PSEU|nr:hypothetical protein [Amycolatopsis alkalitolerans]TNC29160.1 hypothetical protein FG385_03485 [Amycolatopsis alkalitolerans]
MTAPRQTSTGPRRGHSAAAFTWVALLAASVLFTVATGGIGALSIGVVVIIGIAMIVLGQGKRS